MTCRIGITNDPERRKSERKGDFETIKIWQILSTHRSRKAALSAVDRLAREHDCYACKGGHGPEKETYHVYKVVY